MPMTDTYALVQPARADIDALLGPTVLEFGAPWCSICKAAQPLIAQAFGARHTVRHLKVEDGSGLPLGRSFGIKLWPTLIFLQDGKEVSRLVRPSQANAISQALDGIDSPPA